MCRGASRDSSLEWARVWVLLIQRSTIRRMPLSQRLSLQSLVCSEITAVTTQLRAEMRAAAAAYRAQQPSAAGLLRSFAAARTAVLADGAHCTCCLDYLEPFLETIRLEETSGVVTQRALSAVRAFLYADLISLDEASGPRGMASIVRAATYCRFEVTDPAADEVVLMGILQLLVGCVECHSGEQGCSVRTSA